LVKSISPSGLVASRLQAQTAAKKVATGEIGPAKKSVSWVASRSQANDDLVILSAAKDLGRIARRHLPR
jgi:hypothetical protein